MPLFKIAQGPWTLLLKGTLQDLELEVYTNPQKMVYVQLLRVENGVISECVCEFYKPYSPVGDASAFIQTVPREVMLITKHLLDETHTFLLLGTSPVSMNWEESIVLEQTDILLKKLEVSSSLLSEVARAYDVQLKNVNELPPNISEAFFSMPILTPLLATNAHLSEGVTSGKQNDTTAAQHMGALPGEFVLGTTTNGLMVKEPVVFFKRSTVFGGRIEHRKHVLQVIAEGALFSNIPLVIVDWENEYVVMRNPNPNAQLLHDQKIEGDPVGFPMKEFLPGENLKLELSMLYPEGFVEILGLSNTDLGNNLIRFLHEHQTGSIDEAKGILRQLPPSESMTPFHISSMIRLFTLLDYTFPNMFTGMNPTEEISKSWFQSIGRIGVLKMKNVPPKLRNLLVYTIVRGVYELYSRKGVSGRVKSLIVVPEAQQLFDYAREPVLAKEMERLFSQSTTQDVGFMFSAAHEIDLPKNILLLSEAKLSIVGGREVGVTLVGRKNYRATVRDTYSQPVVKDFFTKI